MVTVVNLVPQLANHNPCLQYLGRGLVPVKLGLIIHLIQFAANYHACFIVHGYFGPSSCRYIINNGLDIPPNILPM